MRHLQAGGLSKLNKMLDREVVKEFLEEELKDWEITVPRSIPKRKLAEAFCQFTEDDYYEWLTDNFKTFFEHGNPDWDWIREKIKKYDQPGNP